MSVNDDQRQHPGGEGNRISYMEPGRVGGKRARMAWLREAEGSRWRDAEGMLLLPVRGHDVTRTNE
jgi:hypothetical protein